MYTRRKQKCGRQMGVQLAPERHWLLHHCIEHKNVTRPDVELINFFTDSVYGYSGIT